MMSYPDFSYKQIAVHLAGGNREKIKFHADNIVIEDSEGEILLQHSCHRLFALFIVGEISLTSVALQKSVAFAFPIILMNRNLRVTAVVNCAAEGNTLLRKKQYTTHRNFEIAKELTKLKRANQVALLEQLRTPSESDRETVKLLKSLGIESAQDTRELMGLEGQASHLFFSAYFRSLGWQRREPRCKHDIYNLLLDIGYTYLFQFMSALLSLYGFDLYCGVYHTFFYQRKSLVCDMIEPFRCIVDQRLRKAYNLRQIDHDDFTLKGHQYSLSYAKQEKYTRLFLKDILQEKEALFLFVQGYYRWFVRDRPIEMFPQFQIKG